MKTNQRSFFLVRGQVRFTDGLPAAAYVVSAFTRGLREPKPLGDASTDDQGRYEIRCSLEQVERGGRARAERYVVGGTWGAGAKRFEL